MTIDIESEKEQIETAFTTARDAVLSIVVQTSDSSIDAKWSAYKRNMLAYEKRRYGAKLEILSRVGDAADGEDIDLDAEFAAIDKKIDGMIRQCKLDMRANLGDCIDDMTSCLKSLLQLT